MKIIYFRYDKEVIYFCEVFFRLNKDIQVQWRKNKHWGNELRFQENHVSLEQVITCFVKVFLSERLQPMIRKITREDYFYTEKEEIDRISALVDWIISEESFQTELFGEYESLSTFIFSILKSNMKQVAPIHFDSIITFCMQPINDCLERAVGLGIDEMKREEEYQTFVHSVRYYIKKKEIKTDVLHILQGEMFTFYSSRGEKYSKKNLKKLLMREPLYMIGLDENELNLAPIITLSPKKIYVYGEHPSEAKTLALFNLFEERVQFLPLDQFPFQFNG